MLEVGTVIPEVRLPDQLGVERRLGDLLGARGGILYFYPRDNTPGCTLEANDFQSLRNEFAALELTVTGISKDSVASHQRFCHQRGLTFTLLSDEHGEVCSQFGVWQEKTSYGRTRLGIVRTTFIIDAQGMVQRVYRAVRTKEHAQKVLADAQAMAAEAPQPS